MQTQIAWPLIQSLGKDSLNITLKNGIIATFVAGSVKDVLLKHNPQRPVRAVDSSNNVGFGFFKEIPLRGKIERIFEIDTNIEDVADYKVEGKTVILYKDGSISEINTFVKGLPRSRQKAMQIVSSNCMQVVINVSISEMLNQMTQHGCEFRLLTNNGVSHHVVVTPQVTDKMASNIIRSNDEAKLKANKTLWAALNS